MTAKTTAEEVCPHCEGVGFFVRDGFEVRVCSVTGLLKAEHREVCPACSGTGERGEEREFVTLDDEEVAPF